MIENKNKFNYKLSVIIRCFNEEKYIGNLLEKIFEQTIKGKEIIIVDSGSTDSTLSIAKKFDVKIVQITPEEFTFGYSLNKGCEVASGKFLVMASAHTIPANDDWLEQIIMPFQDSKVALVYGRQMGNSITKFSEHQVFMKQFPAGSNFHQTIPFCNNANVAIRKVLWLKHKYDESLSGLEDLEWGKWVIEQGYEIVYNASACIFHIHEESPGKILNRYKREAIALKKIFPDSHMTFFEFFSLLASNIILDTLRALKLGIGVFFKNIRDIIVFRFMQYWGTYRGLNYRSPLTHEMIMKFYYPRKIARFQRGKSKNKN